MRFISVIVLLLVVTGCGKNIRPDPVFPPSIEAEYPSAEVRACGKLMQLGQSVCSLEKGKPYNNVKLSVYTYYKGVVKVAGRGCQLEQELSYDSTGLMEISIPGIADRNCLITVTVQPKFPNEENSGIKVNSLRGWVAIRVLPANSAWRSDAKKVTGNFSSRSKMFVGEQAEDVQVVVDGCDVVGFTKNIKPVAGYIEIELSEILKPELALGTCVLQGYVRSKVFKDVLFNIMVSKYDPRFTPLPLPVVKINGSKIEVSADAAVSAISVNDEYEITNSGKFDWKADQENTVRNITVGGRSAVGVWKPGKGWAWKN